MAVKSAEAGVCFGSSTVAIESRALNAKISNETCFQEALQAAKSCRPYRSTHQPSAVVDKKRAHQLVESVNNNQRERL